MNMNTPLYTDMNKADYLEVIEEKMNLLELKVKGGIITEQKYISAMEELKDEYFKVKGEYIIENGTWVENIIAEWHDETSAEPISRWFSRFTEELPGRPEDLNINYFPEVLNLYDDHNYISFNYDEMADICINILNGDGIDGNLEVYISKDWSKIIYNVPPRSPDLSGEKWVIIKHFKYSGIVNKMPQFITDY